jgi:hypothetical protein
MAKNILTQMIKWFVATFGKEIVVVVKDAVRSQYRRFFAARNILILGPKQSGKSSLLLYLTKGQPFEVVNDQIRPPAPTALAAIVDEKFALQKDKWLHLKRDVPGDLDLRDTWAQAIVDIQPFGIIYMIDGRQADDALREDVRGIRGLVLDNYSTGTGHLATLHVLVNFADYWVTSANEARRRLRVVREELEALTEAPVWSSLRIGVAETQLSPNKKSWDETKRALEHFGVDLVA